MPVLKKKSGSGMKTPLFSTRTDVKHCLNSRYSWMRFTDTPITAWPSYSDSEGDRRFCFRQPLIRLQALHRLDHNSYGLINVVTGGHAPGGEPKGALGPLLRNLHGLKHMGQGDRIGMTGRTG